MNSAHFLQPASAFYTTAPPLWHHEWVQWLRSHASSKTLALLFLIPLTSLAAPRNTRADSALSGSSDKPAQSQRDTSAQDLQRLLDAQRAATQAGDPAAVASASEKLAALALRQLGNLRLAESANEEAAQAFQQSAALEDSPETHTGLATALLRTGKSQEALAEINSVIASTPGDARAWQIKGGIEMAASDYSAAAKSLAHSLDLHRNVNAMYALGFSLLKLHELDKAKAVFAQMLEAYSDKAIWHVVFGGAYRDTGYPDEAVREFRHALSMDPHAPHAHFFLGLTYLEQNHWGVSPEVIDQFQAEVRMDPQGYLGNFYLGAIESTSRQFAASDEHLRTATKAQPDSPDPWLYLGLNAYQQNNYPQAKKALQTAIDLTGKDESRNNFRIRRAYFALGRIALSEGRTAEGEKLLARFKEMQGKALAESADSIREIMLGAGAAASPNPSETAKSSEADNASTPDDSASPATVSSTANASLNAPQQKQTTALEKQLREVLATAYNDWGTAEARQQQYSEALAHFKQAEQWDPTLPGVTRNVGLAAFRLGNYAESARALALVLAADPAGAPANDPSDQRTRMMLAMSRYSIGDYAGADAAFAPLGDATLQDPRAAYAWAVSLACTGQQQKANQVLDKLTAAPLPPDALALMCQLYNDTENYEHAVTCFRKLSEEDPTARQAHYGVGAALIHLDRPSEAIPELREELKLDPDNPNVKYYLAYALLQTGHKEEAVDLLRAVIAVQPEHADAQYELGKYLLDNGKVDEAIPHLEAAARLAPTRDYTHYQLQTAYRRAGRKQDADRELKLYSEIKAKRREIPTRDSAPATAPPTR